jgi:phytoene synthase
MRLLAPERREAMYAVYAFCREVDDIADADAPPAQKVQGIEDWRSELERLFVGNPTYPTSRALLDPIATFDLPKEEFIAVLDGMAMDAAETMVAPSMEDFILYCRRVAGSVGMLSVHAFGDAGDKAKRLAIVQGEALQITNILRDLGEDAKRGRLYLPRESLNEAGINSRDPHEVLKHPALPKVCAKLAELAELRFRESRELIADCDTRALKPASVILEAYYRLLLRLKVAAWRDPWHEISLPRAEKLWVALRYGLFG